MSRTSSSICIKISLKCHFFLLDPSFHINILNHIILYFVHIFSLPADRSSRLAELDGFRYFQLMRRVGLDNEVNSGELYFAQLLKIWTFSNFDFFAMLLIFFRHFFQHHAKGIDPLASTDPFGNYVSFTIWEEKKHFNAWRGGEAFKEVSCISLYISLNRSNMDFCLKCSDFFALLLTFFSSLFLSTIGSWRYFLICFRYNHGIKRPRTRGCTKTCLLRWLASTEHCARPST